jgi:hypothetical protein
LVIKLDKPKTTEKHSISVDYTLTAPRQTHVDAVSHNDSIHFTAPPNLSAEVDISTNNSSIHSDLPIKTQGDISKSKIKGVIGSGAGRVYLHTHNGSIRIH